MVKQALVSFLTRIDVQPHLPKNRVGDYCAALQAFVRAHGRLPRRSLHLNDYLFRITTSDECLNPLRVFVTDKEFVKMYVKATVGDRYNVPTIGVLRSIADCESFGFPDACAIKPTHLSGAVITRLHGEPVNFAAMARWFETNWYHRKGGWEANYRHLQPKVIVEPLVFGDHNATDYKIFCWRGAPKMIQVDCDRRTRHTRALFDFEWNRLPVSFCYPSFPGLIDRPQNLRAMLDLAGELSRPFDLIRVDLYSDGAEVMVGELTNCAEGALGKFEPAEGEAIVDELIFGS